MLSAKVREFLETQLPWITTVDQNGMPNIGPKRSLRFLDETHLIYNENTMGKHAANITANGRIVVGLANWEKLSGVRIIGTAKLYQEGEYFEMATEWAKGKMGAPKAAVVITVEKLENLASGPKAGTAWEE